MADQRSIEMLAFNFASRTFAYKRLAQGLSRALCAFSSFMREYLDKVIKADQCAQDVDDIGIAANSVTPLTRNNRTVFECIIQAGFRLTAEKSHFGVTEEPLHHKELLPRTTKFKNSWQNRRSKYIETQASSTIIATTSRGCQKNCSDFTNS